MKKIALAITLAALVGASSSCFAGFSMPKMPGASKPAVTNEKTDDSKLGSTSEAVDLDGMMAKQKQMTQYMLACNNLAVDAWVELHNSTGNDVTALLTAKKAQNDSESAEDAEKCDAAITNAAKDPIDEAKVKANKEAVKAAIAQAKELKTQAENERTKAAIMLPSATGEIGTAAKKALKDFSFAKQFSPVKKAFNLNKKLLSASDKNLKAMNAHIAKLEKLIAD